MGVQAHRILAIILASFSLSIVFVHSQIPIPRREVGFVYGAGQANASIHLDVYIDLICSDSNAAMPTVLKVAEFYGPSTLRLTTHLFSLPYFRNSFYTAKGANAIHVISNGLQTYNWFQLIFDNSKHLTNKATHSISDADVVQRLVKLASDLIPESGPEFQRLVDSNTVVRDTIVAWKYACTRGVAATPTFMVNDIEVAAGTDWTMDDWQEIIDPLLA